MPRNLCLSRVSGDVEGKLRHGFTKLNINPLLREKEFMSKFVQSLSYEFLDDVK
jgi:hypothetical protein